MCVRLRVYVYACVDKKENTIGINVTKDIQSINRKQIITNLCIHFKLSIIPVQAVKIEPTNQFPNKGIGNSVP